MTETFSSIEAVVANAEETWDALADSGIAEVIPVAGRIVKIWRAAHDVRDALFAAKLRAFITDPSLQTSEARVAMRMRAESDEAKKIGETLLLVIEGLNDMQKPIWLSKVYAAYLTDQIKASDLRRLMSAIDMAFGDDLIQLINSPETSGDDKESWKRNLASAGLTDMSVSSPLGGTHISYPVNTWGRLLRKAVRDHS